MKFANAASVAVLVLAIFCPLHDAAGGSNPNSAQQTAIFVANGDDVTAYPVGGTGDVSPIAVTTDLASPSGIARDSSGRLYVTNRGSNTVTVFSASANGNVPPIAVIGGSNTRLSSPSAIALGSDGTIYVANDSGTETGSVTVYPPLTGSGLLNEAPTAQLAGSKTLLDVPSGIALDSQGRVYVANESGDPAARHRKSDVGAVTIYAAGSTGNVAPIATIKGARTGLDFPVGIALDANDNIYVLNFYTAGGPQGINASITVYQAGSKGNDSPIATIAGANTTVIPFGGIAVDAVGNIYIEGCAPGGGLTACTTVNVFSPASNGNVSPATIIFDGADATAIAVDSSRNIYVLNRDDGVLPGGEIVSYAAGSSGNAVPIATIQDNFTGTAGASGVALDSAGTIYVAESFLGADGGSINSYPAGSYATGIPASTIAGPHTGIFHPLGVALDSSGDIFVQFSDAVSKYQAGSAGDAPPGAVFFINGSTVMTGLAVNPQGRLYVTVGAEAKCRRKSCHQANAGKIVIWPAGSDGSAGPSSVITGPNTSLTYPSAISLDSSGTMYVTNEGPLKCVSGCACIPNGSGSVTVYAPASNGNAKPIARIAGKHTGLVLPNGIALDPDGNIYVLNAGIFALPNVGTPQRIRIGVPSACSTGFIRTQHRILIFPNGSNGDVAPIASIDGSFTGLDFPRGIAIGATGL